MRCARFVRRSTSTKTMRMQARLGPTKIDSDNYPESLEQLVEGVKAAGSVDKKIKFLRRIPKDPMTNSTEWGKRSTQDDPTSQSWGGQNRLRRVHQEHGQGARWNSLCGVVTRRRGIACSRRARLHADRADDRDGDHLDADVDRRADLPEVDQPRRRRAC